MGGTEKTGVNGTEETGTVNGSEATELTANNQSLASKVQEVLSGQESQDGAKTKVEAPYGFTREGKAKKRNYPPRKKSKKKGNHRKPFKKEPVSAKSTESTASGSNEKTYESYKAEYEQSLDPDARENSGEDSIVNDPNNIQQAEAVVQPKRKYGNSLVVITQFVLPVFCTLATRLISRGKKKPDSADFRLDDFEKEMLRELAEDGAGEEILGRMNPALVYGIVAIALGANKTMDYWDKDEYQIKMKEMDELLERFNDLEAKYNKLVKESTVENANVME